MTKQLAVYYILRAPLKTLLLEPLNTVNTHRVSLRDFYGHATKLIKLQLSISLRLTLKYSAIYMKVCRFVQLYTVPCTPADTYIQPSMIFKEAVQSTSAPSRG